MLGAASRVGPHATHRPTRAGPLGLMLLSAGALRGQATPVGPAVADAVTVTIISSNLADGSTIGEWGFSALVKVDGQCVLFDTGRYPDTVLRNAQPLHVDRARVSL